MRGFVSTRFVCYGNMNSYYSITTVPFEIYSILKVGNKKKSDVLSKVKGGTIEIVTTQETPVTLEKIPSKRHVIIFYFSLHKKQPEYS